MSGGLTISISERTGELAPNSFLSALSKIWQREGHRVDVGKEYRADADVCILHHDLTRLEPSTVPAPPPGVQAVNGHVLDISKKTYSTLRILPGECWPGPVIIKSNFNHFGRRERLERKEGIVARWRRRLADVAWRHVRMLPQHAYPILNSSDDVPSWVWNEPDLIVEKFMPERGEGDLYCVRAWIFLGDKGYAYRAFSPNPLVKTGTTARYEFFETVPDELAAQRRKLAFDFGKFDYVEHDGKAILLDANKTPSYSGSGNSPRMNMLAEGIGAFI